MPDQFSHEALAAATAFIAALVSTLAAVFASSQASTAKAQHSQSELEMHKDTMLAFLRDDAESETGESIGALWEIRRKQYGHLDRNKFADEVAKLKSVSDPIWKDIADARRPVHKQYLRLMQLKMATDLPDEIFIQFVTGVGLETVYQVLQPIEQCMVGAPYTKPVFDEYDRIVREYPQLYKRAFGKALDVDWPPSLTD